MIWKKKYWYLSAVKYLITLYCFIHTAQGQISLCTEQRGILLDSLSLVWPGSISATTGSLLAFTSVRKENGRECLTFFGAQSGKWYVIQMCQGEEKMGRDRKQRERANYSPREGLKTEEAFLIRRILQLLTSWNSNPPRISFFWSNNVSINIQGIIMNGIIPPKMPTIRQ